MAAAISGTTFSPMNLRTSGLPANLPPFIVSFGMKSFGAWYFGPWHVLQPNSA